MKKTKAVVYKPATNKMRMRVGRGFSVGEIKEAGLDIKKARELGIYVDKRRRSVHKENIEILREFLEERRS